MFSFSRCWNYEVHPESNFCFGIKKIANTGERKKFITQKYITLIIFFDIAPMMSQAFVESWYKFLNNLIIECAVNHEVTCSFCS